MAIIYSYPLANPLISDFILGTHDVNQVDGEARNVTVNFTVSSLLNLIATNTGAQTLQQVTNLGATTTNAVTFNGSIAVLGTLKDSFGNVGTIGQVLSSSVIGTRWISDNAGLNYFVTGAAFNTGTGVLSITGNNAAVGATVDLDGRYITSNQTITLSGDITGSGTTAITTVLATVNSNVGSFTNANISVNAKGLITAAANGTAGGVSKIVAGDRITITPATGLGDVTINSAIAPVTSLTTTGSSGVSTLSSGVLNIPNYANTQNTLTTTGTGVATLVGTVLNIPTPVIPVVNFTSLTTTGTGAATLTTGVLNVPTPVIPVVNFTSLTTTGTSGVSTLTSGVLNIPDYTYTEVDTLQTVTTRGNTTNKSITMNGSGAEGYLYITGNAGNPVTNPTHAQGFAFAYNNSGGSRECEVFWNTGTTTVAVNNSAYLGFYNEFLNSDAGNARVSDLQMKLYGTGQLELTGNTPTISNPYWRMPTVAAPNTGYVLAKSSGSIDLEWVVNGAATSGVDEEVVVTSGVATLIKTITIPSGATSTGVNGFSGEGITSLVFPTSLLVIGVDSFNDNKIASLSLPNNLTTIGNNSFASNLLTGTLAIPASVTSIGSSSFGGNSIQTLTFTGTSTLPTIGSGAFSNNALVSLVIPPSVTSIGSDAFTNQFNAAGATLTSISFSSTAMTINGEAFSNNTALPTITIPNNYILNGAVFAFCQGVTSVNLGTGVTLNDGTFSGLTSLTTITFPTGTIITGGSLLQQCTSLQTINFTDAPTTIPSAFASLCTSFTGGTNLFNAASATFASSITTFKSSCFNGAKLPTTVNFTVVTVFENDCFASTAITTVNAKTGSSIASNAFPIGTTINLT